MSLYLLSLVFRILGPAVPAAGIWVSGCKHLALPAEIRSSASCLRSFVTQNSDFLCAAFSSIIRDATWHSDFLRLLINYSWHNVKIVFAFSTIIRDTTFIFSSPSHQLFVTQHWFFSVIHDAIHSDFSSRHHGQVLMNTFWVVLSFSSVIHDST